MRQVPTTARWLGLLGLVPQVALLLAVLAGPPEWNLALRTLAAFYGATILSFLGGTWWGIAAGAPAAERRRALGWLWFAAVTPSLIAIACLAPLALGWPWPEPSLVMLSGALLVALGVDAKLGALAPRWWMGLRVPLSIGLGAATLALALL